MRYEMLSFDSSARLQRHMVSSMPIHQIYPSTLPFCVRDAALRGVATHVESMEVEMGNGKGSSQGAGDEAGARR
eukprot:scaffold30021_cov31-Tisochrysis_lutea.AAC.1